MTGFGEDLGVSPEEFGRVARATRGCRPSGDKIRPVPLADYFSAIPEDDFDGYHFSARRVVGVYRDMSGRFLHFSLAATAPDVLLVIVVDDTYWMMGRYTITHVPAGRTPPSGATCSSAS